MPHEGLPIAGRAREREAGGAAAAGQQGPGALSEHACWCALTGGRLHSAAPVVHASKDMGAAFSSSSSPDFLSMIQEKNAENPVIVYSK